ncbi:probable protein S-acyltransferase 15 isoform X2 [Momordica charantia]|uniref:S-acyltransferase n=1 Tax=Momordica charantia TaxID=3673 RepID=A0A6J1BYF0_MOMCH|nr:probable protein S-acyltransferase 15 isoform X2 [Momordica charantia]
MKLKKFVSVPIFCVFSLMGFVYYITVFIFIEDWTGLLSSPGLLNSLIFTSLASLCLFSFATCVLTDPGSVPSSYLPDVEENAGSDQDAKCTALQMKHCEKCSTYKPPRTHHCRVCRRCVLRMDHHCLWINNCVGYWNYKSFFVLVAYGTMASIHSTFIIVSCAFQKNWNLEGMLPVKIFYVICGAMVISLTTTLGTLLAWHIYLIIRNMTTIEYYEGIRAAWLARKSGQSYQHPFDLGAYRNITLVLGPNVLKWAWPTSVSHLKDGLSFPTLRDSS